ncbi:MAG TPA: hypothetical protein PKI27_10990 [Dermatophilaceae bacterium]|jgi:hypothetical protein|nr:hypothetical protein [Dermatophilaceae bacterium]HOR15211.1 hypothetical protein [Dermatophilaceae bacterium]
MLSIAEVFDRYDLELSESDFARELARSLADAPAPTDVSARLLTDLQESGGLTDPARLSTWSQRDDRDLRVAVQSTMLSDLLAATYSASQTAELLSISRSRLSHKTKSVPLLTALVGRHRRYYRWQFSEGHIVPGLGILADHLTGDEHPLDIATMMTSRSDDLDGRTPVDFLVTGGNPVLVARLLEGLSL